MNFSEDQLGQFFGVGSQDAATPQKESRQPQMESEATRVAEDGVPGAEEAIELPSGEDASFLLASPQKDEPEADATSSAEAASDSAGDGEEEYEYVDDAGNVIPREEAERLLASQEAHEPDYYFSETAQYRSKDEARKGFLEKDRYISQLRLDMQEREKRIQEYESNLQQLRDEFEVREQVFRRGMDEDAYIRSVARTLMPEDLRDIDPESFKVDRSKFYPNKDVFINDYVDSQVDPDDFDSDFDLKEARKRAKSRAERAYEKQLSQADELYEKAREEAVEKRLRFTQAEAEATAKVKAQYEQAKAQNEQVRQKAVQRYEQAQRDLEQLLQTNPLNLKNTEDFNRAKRLLEQPFMIFRNGQEEQVALKDILLHLQAEFGAPVVNRIYSGIRAELSGTSAPERKVVRRVVIKSKDGVRPQPTGGVARRASVPITTDRDREERNARMMREAMGL